VIETAAVAGKRKTRAMMGSSRQPTKGASFTRISNISLSGKSTEGNASPTGLRNERAAEMV
jgi:hypothetical protein